MTGQSSNQSETLRNVAVSAKQRAHDSTRAQRQDAKNERRRTKDAEFSQSKEQVLLNNRIKEWCELHGKQPPLPKLTAAVHNVIENWFALVDDDASGTLEIQELEMALKASNLPCARGNITELLDLMDFNRDLTISRDEFLLFFLTEWGRGKNLLSGDYILPSGLALPLGAMVSKMKRERLMRDVMHGGDNRKRWMEVSQDTGAIQRELNTTDLGDPALLEAASHGRQLLQVAYTSFMKSFHHRDEQLLSQRDRGSTAARAAAENARKARRSSFTNNRMPKAVAKAAVGGTPDSSISEHDTALESAATFDVADGDGPGAQGAAGGEGDSEAAAVQSASVRDAEEPPAVAACGPVCALQERGTTAAYSDTLAQARVAEGVAPPPHMVGMPARMGPGKGKTPLDGMSSWEVQAAVKMQQRLAKVISQVPGVDKRRHGAPAAGSRARHEAHHHQAGPGGASARDVAERRDAVAAEPSSASEEAASPSSSPRVRQASNWTQQPDDRSGLSAAAAARLPVRQVPSTLRSASSFATAAGTMPALQVPAPSASSRTAALPTLPALSAVRTAEWSQFVGTASAPVSPSRAVEHALLPELSSKHTKQGLSLPKTSSVSTSWDTSSSARFAALRSTRSSSELMPRTLLPRPSLLTALRPPAVGASELGGVGLMPGMERSHLLRASVVGQEAPGAHHTSSVDGHKFGAPAGIRMSPIPSLPEAPALAAAAATAAFRPGAPELPRLSVALPSTWANPKAAAAVISLSPFGAGSNLRLG